MKRKRYSPEQKVKIIRGHNLFDILGSLYIIRINYG